MRDFNDIRFKGTFRNYQQTVLDKADSHIRDGKIHIVAAPGSGKTILGLELIRRIGKPALILSPSVTVKQQWGDRFSSFLPEEESLNDYISFDLTHPKLLTSVTYQSLHAAFNKMNMSSEQDEESYEDSPSEDYTDFDLIKAIRKAGIGTLCLDEAHHLRSEWQKALEGFISALGGEVVTVALTATPPYDSTPAEWTRYSAVCGEIDEEIFVPQLVAQKTLCPHQDYIYFSYPTDEEAQLLSQYRKNASAGAEEVLNSQLIKKAIDASGITLNAEKEELLLENPHGFSALFCVAEKCGVSIPSDLKDIVSSEKKKPVYSLTTAEIAFQFVLDSPEIFGKENSEELKKTLSKYALIEQRKVCLNINEKLNKLLLASTGKLDSISKIAFSELTSMGPKLRMLILTDYIKKDLTGIIGTQDPISAMGTVPIFEAVRRSCSKEANIALLSGSLVIVPDTSIGEISKLAADSGISCTFKALSDTGYSEARFSGSIRNSVSVMTAALGRGIINIMIGTKALLGEGWDSPCINSLILASFVGSFMLSNQMRGRAIRIDPSAPDKCSNIWHLVTVDPDFVEDSTSYSDKSTVPGNDYTTVERRFSCFLAPAYSRDVIESGISRIDILKPPYDKNGIENINRQMLSLAADRTSMALRWEKSMSGFSGSTDHAISEISEVSPEIKPAAFFSGSILKELILAAVFILLIVLIVFCAVFSNSVFSIVVLGILAFIDAICFLVGLPKALSFSSPEKTAKTLCSAVLSTLKQTGEIKSRTTKLNVHLSDEGEHIICMLENASAHEKKVFTNAINEMMSPIENPRYLIIKQSNFLNQRINKYSVSYACPSVIGAKKENAELLAKELCRRTDTFDVFYTRNANGRKILLKCLKNSYINKRCEKIKSRQRLISK